MEKKKVLFIVHHLTIGGVQKSLISALNSIDYNLYDVTLYVRKNRVELLSYINKNVTVIVNDDNTHYYANPSVVLLSLKNKISRSSSREQIAAKLRELQNKNEFSRYFKDKHYDIAVSYMQGYDAEFMFDYINADKKIMCYQGSVDEIHDAHIKFIYKLDNIVVEHISVQEMLQEAYPETNSNQYYILPNYTDVDLIKQQAGEMRPETGSFTICTCGRMAPVKGFDLAVEAAKLLKVKSVDFLWYFVGDGPECDKVKSLIEKYNLKDNIILAGMQKNPYPYIDCADIFVQPSYEEAMSIAVLEAQVLNKPVVTTKTVGGMNIVKDNITGIQTEINAESLADGIIKAMNPELLRSMREQLSLTDYTKEKERYKRQWAELLS